MGLLHLTYLFPGEPPAWLTLAEQVTCLVAEAMQVEEADGLLACPAMDDYLWFYPVEQLGQQGYAIETIALGGSYLLDALVSVLRAAGGVGLAPRHDVSGLSWQQAQALYPAWPS